MNFQKTIEIRAGAYQVKLRNPYRLHLQIRLENATPSQIAKAIGMLCRRHVKPRQVYCSMERLNETRLSFQAEKVTRSLLALPSPWHRLAETTTLREIRVMLDDRQVRLLARQWDKIPQIDCMIVLPHLFYLPLLTCCIRHLEIQDPQILHQLILLFSYPNHAQAMEPDLISQCYFGERATVLNYVRKMGLSYVDLGHQLYVENQISLAAYMIPARRLIFIDDDYFIRQAENFGRLVEPLNQGYLLSGLYSPAMKKIHTCFFALDPAYLRDELRLYDNGENLYYEDLRDTGAITYEELSRRKKGVWITEESIDGNGSSGRHLGHCGGELWFDFPVILKQVYQVEQISAQLKPGKLSASVLLDALALVYGLDDTADQYLPVEQLKRDQAVQNFPDYFTCIYRNHRWLEQQAKAAEPRLL
jgi:hypothetical protein